MALSPPCPGVLIVISDLGLEMVKNGKGTVTPTDSGMEGDLSPHKGSMGGFACNS